MGYEGDGRGGRGTRARKGAEASSPPIGVRVPQASRERSQICAQVSSLPEGAWTSPKVALANPSSRSVCPNYRWKWSWTY